MKLETSDYVLLFYLIIMLPAMRLRSPTRNAPVCALANVTRRDRMRLLP